MAAAAPPASGDATALRLLMVEDSEDDAAVLRHVIGRTYTLSASRRVETEAALVAALEEADWDVVLADYRLPAFDAPAALRVVRRHRPELPFIVVSGAIGDEPAVAMVRGGADDYLLKDRLSRLPAAIEAAVEQRRLRRAALEALEALRASERLLSVRAQQLHALNEFGQSVTRALDLRSLVTLVVEEALRVSTSSWCAVMQYDRESRVLVLCTARWRDDEAAGPPRGPAHTFDVALMAPAVWTRRLHVVPRVDVGQADDSAAVTEGLAGLTGIRIMVGVPIICDNRVWGVLALGADDPRAMPDETVQLLTGMAGYFGIALQNAALFAQAQTARAALQEAQEQIIAQERLRALGEMASGVAHDFNNALASVVGYCELLLHTPGGLSDPAQARQYVELISAGAQDAAGTVRRLNEFSRPREQAAEYADVALAPLLAKVALLTQPKWRDQAQGEGKTITVLVDCADALSVQGDEGELREALTNLIFNAVDAMPTGGAITLRGRQAVGSCTLEVVDSGAGMDDNVRRRCMEPFFTTKGARGNGLGLAMVHGTVGRHGGTLEIDSAPSHGTTMRIRLPSAMGGEARVVAIAPVADPTDAPPRSLHVLVVDDDHAAAEVTVSLLAIDGHVAVGAPDGASALERLGRDRFDLVVTDRSMPGMNGDDLAVAIKRRSPETPVVLLTGFGDLLIRSGRNPEGVDIVLGKPVTLTRLRDALATVTARYDSAPATG